MEDLSREIDLFLQKTQVRSQHAALANALNAAMGQHKPMYRQGSPPQLRSEFGAALKREVLTRDAVYQGSVSDEDHVRVIVDIAKLLTREYGRMLAIGYLQSGTTQKMLNLYLKFMWCLHPERPIPPHCPLDRNVLHSARILRNWTDLDSAEDYMCWIERLRDCAREQGYAYLSQWELVFWNRLQRRITVPD